MKIIKTNLLKYIYISKYFYNTLFISESISIY